MPTPSERSPAPLIKQASKCAKEGRWEESLTLLHTAIRDPQISPEELDKAGRLLTKCFAATNSQPTLRLLMLGQCTTSWLAPVMPAVAWRDRMRVSVTEGEYDNVIQELISPVAQDVRADVVIFVPWTQRLLFGADHRGSADRIESELGFWRQAWSLAANNHSAKMIQVGYDWIAPGPLGHHLGGSSEGDVATIRRMNDLLRQNLPAGAFFVDLEQVAGVMGRSSFYDRRRYFWTKQPFSEQGTALLVEHIWAGVRAVMQGPKKVLVLDLDNTLWGGVVGETGPLGISLGETADGEAFRAFQRHAKGLAQRGIVLAIASKNNHADAIAPFEQNPQMVLKLDDFAEIQAHWEPKDQSLRRIAETLKLGLDSFVFFDDNPAERELIRCQLPEVAVVDVPLDPAEYVDALQAELWFEAAALLEADSQRSQQYRQEKERRELETQFNSLEDYLKSLEMEAILSPIDATNIQRVVQLIGKTNQFNLTTRRHSHEDVNRMIREGEGIGLTLSLRDRFGDHGLISVMIAVPATEFSERALLIDTWLMSCRVISRTAEDFFLNVLIARARSMGYDTLIGEFHPTSKNELVANLYPRLGFETLEKLDNGLTRYRLSLDNANAAVSFIREKDATQ